MRPRIHHSSTRPNFSVLDLFSGCGGLTEGFTSVRDRPGRFMPIAAVELDVDAAATYAANFGSHVFQGDIVDWIGLGVPRADVVIGGPPCQGFSALGKRDPRDERNKLWLRYAEAVSAAQPYYFVLENVTPFLRSEQFAELERQTRSSGQLSEYTLEGSPMSVRAKDFGAAQDRRRAVVVGRRRDLPPVNLDAYRLPQRTTRDAFSGVEADVTETHLPDRHAKVKAANRTLDVPGVFSTTDLHLTRQFTTLSQRRFRRIPAGGNRHDLPDALKAPCWLRPTSGSNDVMGRLHWDRPAVTIRTEFWKPEKGRYLHPVADRSITHMEAALLQGFPEDYRWCGSKSSIGRQIGNAVPVELGRAVAAAILDALAATGLAPTESS